SAGNASRDRCRRHHALRLERAGAPASRGGCSGRTRSGCCCRSGRGTCPRADRGDVTSSPRLEALLGGPALAWLRARARARMSRARARNGGAALAKPAAEERSAIERLFGRMTRGRALRVDLDELATILRRAEVCADLADALVQIDGPVENRRAVEAERAS